MTATPPRAGRADAARFEQELLARLGLPAGASSQDVDTAHDELVQFLEGAPSSLSAWADREIAVADEAYALLSDPTTDLAAVAASMPLDVIPTPAAATDAEPVAMTRAAVAAPRRSRLASPVTRVAIAAAAIVGVVAIAYVGYNAGAPSVPGFTGTPAPEASAGAQIDQARVAELMKKISADPKDVTSLQALGDIYYQVGDYETAGGWMEKILAVDPKNLTARLALGAALFNLGKPDDAEKQWRQVLEIDPDNLEAHYDLGFMYLSRNPPDTANVKAEWSRVIEIAPDSDVAKTVATHLQSLEGSPAPSGAASASPATSPSASPEPSPTAAPAASPRASGS